MAETILIIEDERRLGAELRRHYESAGWDSVLCDSIAESRRLILNEDLQPLVILSEMNLPDGNALDLLEELNGARSGSEWIFLTSHGSVPDSVRALRLGAFDFLEKPCDQERLDVVVNGATRSAKAQRRLSYQAEAGSRRFAPGSFLGRSDAARNVRTMLERLCEVPFSALIITGETGTGKGLCARILHHSGQRRDESLVEVNCAALPKDLLESELFGHEAGAFTGARGRRRGLFEQADGGTLFLDEISEMDVELQSKLLNAIEDQTIRRVGGEKEIAVDVQIVAASNRDLEAHVRDSIFRGDLYHRLSAFKLHLPPLRERKQDLEDIVPTLIEEFNAAAGRRVRVISAEVWETLNAHDWPGNIRELRNVIERCVLFSDGDEFPTRWLQLGSVDAKTGSEPRVKNGRLTLPVDGSMSLDSMDELIIKTALKRSGNNVTAAARLLGTTRETLRYRIQKYGLR
ncbi:MAG TPA: sigma-54 dependent transcriptional regulator [Gammaproteobacteria bacterium]|nr:sigma-54 dependent transcriptional regulator [Gammaproteobacteria bacterium]